MKSIARQFTVARGLAVLGTVALVMRHDWVGIWLFLMAGVVAMVEK